MRTYRDPREARIRELATAFVLGLIVGAFAMALIEVAARSPFL